MTTQEAHGQPQVTEERTTASTDGVVGAAVVGSVLGGLIGGLVLYALTTFHVPFVGSLVGFGAMPAALGVWLGLALVLGLVFGSIAEPAIGYYRSAGTWVTARIASLGKLADTVPVGAAGGTGLLYGLVVGAAVGLVGVPSAVGGNVPPVEAGPILAGYAVYGLVLGIGYGAAREGTIPVPSFTFASPAARAAAFAPLLAGAISGAIVYAGQPLYLRYLATIPGYGTVGAGFGLWMGLSLVLGLVFAYLALDHAARGNATTGYGFVYGVVLAVFVGLLAVPAVVSATTPWNFAYGDVGGATLAAFLVYGVTLGSVFGKMVNRRPLRPGFLVGRSRATVIAALVAGGLTGALLYQAAPVSLILLAELAGGGGYAAGFAVWLGLAVLLGFGFAAFPARRVERRDYPGQTGVKVGLGYGLLVALPVGLLVVPQAVGSTTRFSTAPLTGGAVLGAYVLFGLLHGIAYGGIKGSGRITPVFLQGRGRPVLGGVVAGAAAGAVVAYAASVTPGFYFRFLGGMVGQGSVGAGLAVWFGLALLFGVLFVPLAANYVEAKPGLARGLSVGGVYGGVLAVLVGMFAVPSATLLEAPYTNPPVVAYFVYGLAFGGVYGVLRDRTLADERAPAPTAIGTRGQRAIVFGAMFGGSVGGLIVHHAVGAQPVAMLLMGALVGYPGSISVGWAVWLGLSLIMGMAFAVAVGPRLDGYARSMDEYVGRDEDLEAVFGDVVDRSPMTAAATLAGLVYGIVLAVAVGAIALPFAINTTTQFSVSTPLLHPYFLLAFVLYGLVMGLGYGVVREF